MVAFGVVTRLTPLSRWFFRILEKVVDQIVVLAVAVDGGPHHLPELPLFPLMMVFVVDGDLEARCRELKERFRGLLVRVFQQRHGCWRTREKR